MLVWNVIEILNDCVVQCVDDIICFILCYREYIIR